MSEEKVVWEIDSTNEGSLGGEWLKRKLAEGWEPFAVTRIAGGDNRIHLRRKVVPLTKPKE